MLYLRNHLATGVLLGAGAYVVGQLVAATTRGAGGPLLGRLSTRSALILGGCVAGGGILLESVSPVAGVAALGLALGAGGASLFWPLVMSTVSQLASQVVSAVGTFTAAGYVGWVAGAPIVGWVSQTFGAARGLQVLALASFGVVACTLVSPQRRVARNAQRVAWEHRHDPPKHRDARRRQGPEPRATRRIVRGDTTSHFTVHLAPSGLSGGTFHLKPDGNEDTTTGAGGTVIGYDQIASIASGHTSTNISVGDAHVQIVQSDATALSTTVADGGEQDVFGTASGTVLSGTEVVYGKDSGATDRLRRSAVHLFRRHGDGRHRLGGKRSADLRRGDRNDRAATAAPSWSARAARASVR